MRPSLIKQISTATAFAALVTGFMSGHAYACENHLNHSTGTSDLPQPSQQGEVSFKTGGIGLDESQALRREASHWPLALQFTDTDGSYLANVEVWIIDAKGAQVLKADSHGPYMLVRLRPGRYTVHARYQDREQTRSINVQNQRSTPVAFYWKNSE